MRDQIGTDVGQLLFVGQPQFLGKRPVMPRGLNGSTVGGLPLG